MHTLLTLILCASLSLNFKHFLYERWSGKESSGNQASSDSWVIGTIFGLTAGSILMEFFVVI